MEGKTGLVNISNCRLNLPQDWSISFAHSHTKKKKGKGGTESSPSMGGLSYSSVVKMTFCLHWRGTDQLRSYSGRGVDFWHSLVAGPSLPAFSIVPDRADATLWYLFIYWVLIYQRCSACAFTSPCLTRTRLKWNISSLTDFHLSWSLFLTNSACSCRPKSFQPTNDGER